MIQSVQKYKAPVRLAIGFICAAILIFVALQAVRAVRAAREAAHRTACHQNLYFLGFALRNYHENEGTFPPAFVADSDRQPLYSWRVLLSQYIDQREFHDEYDFEAPWDNSNNFRIAQAEDFVYLFACPSGRHYSDPRDVHVESARPRYTNYVAITGPGTAFPGASAVSSAQIKDGAENTILLAEIANSTIHWSEPRDLRIDRMSFKVNDSERLSISSDHTPEGAGVLFADGRYFFLRNEFPPAVLKALLTINGGESIDRADLVRRGVLGR